MGQITRLAILEPGENMVEETCVSAACDYSRISALLQPGFRIKRCAGCRYNDINFELPNGWTNETPQKGGRSGGGMQCGVD